MSGSSGASLWKQRPKSVESRASIQAIGVNVDRESVIPTIFSSQSKGKRDRDEHVVHSLKDRENLQNSAVRGERMAQQKLYEAEAEVEARNWEKRNSDIAFQEINQ